MNDIIDIVPYPTAYSNMSFRLDDKEFLSISKDGLKFNREEFPEWSSEDFAKQFMDILELKYSVKFTCKGKDENT